MVGTILSFAEATEYHPGFQDLNLFVVVLYLIGFLYAILIAAIGYRVLSTRAKLREVERLLEKAKDAPELEASLVEVRTDRDQLCEELARLTSSAPGKWFAGRKRDSVMDPGEPT